MMLSASAIYVQPSIEVLATGEKAANLMNAALDQELRAIEVELRTERSEQGEFE